MIKVVLNLTPKTFFYRLLDPSGPFCYCLEQISTENILYRTIVCANGMSNGLFILKDR